MPVQFGLDSMGPPPRETIQISREHGALIGSACRALDRLAGAVAAMPLAGAHRKMQLRSEAVASSILDGNQVSVSDLLAIEAGLSSPEDRPAAGLALQAARSAELATDRERAGDLHPDALAGLLDVLDPGASSTQGAEAPGAEYLARILVGKPGRHGVPELVDIAITQGMVELTGPFGETNGIAGRIAAFVLLDRHCGAGVGLARFLAHHQEEYREALDSIARSSTWGDWIGFFVRAVTESAIDSLDQVSRFVALREKHRDAMIATLGYAVSKALVVQDRLFWLPIATVSDVQRVTQTSYVAANTLVGRLADLGVLEEVTGYRRNRVFGYGRYTTLFSVGGQVWQRLPAASTRGAVPKTRRRAPAPPPAPSPEPKPAPRKSPKPTADHLL